MESRLIIKVTIRFGANSENCVLVTEVKCLLSRARVRWDATKEFFISLG